MTRLKLACASLGTLLLVGQANAGLLTSHAQLSALLGVNETLEDFEGNGQLPAGQISDSFLNSVSTFSGYGPGLVQAGVDYSSGTLFWNDHGYFGLNTRTLGDASAWRGLATNITYTSAVTAMGFDMQGYSGYLLAGTVDVYDTFNNLLSSTAVNGGFFGWEAAGGIGKVVVSANSDGYIMIDNHGYGSAPVPEPFTMGLAGLALATAARRRLRKSA